MSWDPSSEPAHRETSGYDWRISREEGEKWKKLLVALLS